MNSRHKPFLEDTPMERTGRGRSRLFLVGLVSLTLVGLSKAIGPVSSTDTEPSVYVKRGTWTETMLATRTSFLRPIAEQSSPDLLPELWKRIAADFPDQARWFSQDAGNRHLEWFTDATAAKRNRAVLRRTLRRLGSRSDALQEQFDALCQTGAMTDDGRWLDLFVRARRYHECRESLDRIWIRDLQRIVEGRLDDILGPHISPDDPRWSELHSVVGRIVERLPAGHAIDMANMRASIESLQKALPARFIDGDRLLKRLETHRRK